MGKDLGKYAMNIRHLLTEIVSEIPEEKRSELLRFFQKTNKCELELFCSTFNKISAIYISKTPSKRKAMLKTHQSAIDDIRTASLYEVARTVQFLKRLDVSLYSAGAAYRDFAAEITFMLQNVSYEESVEMILDALTTTDV